MAGAQYYGFKSERGENRDGIGLKRWGRPSILNSWHKINALFLEV